MTTTTYRIVRHYSNGLPRTIRRGLTLEQAQAHCRNPETNGRTATGAAAARRTRRCGFWFDGYDFDRPAR